MMIPQFLLVILLVKTLLQGVTDPLKELVNPIHNRSVSPPRAPRAPRWLPDGSQGQAAKEVAEERQPSGRTMNDDDSC